MRIAYGCPCKACGKLFSAEKDSFLHCSFLSSRNVHRNQQQSTLAIFVCFCKYKTLGYFFFVTMVFCKANERKTKEKENVANIKIHISFSERRFSGGYVLQCLSYQVGCLGFTCEGQLKVLLQRRK